MSEDAIWMLVDVNVDADIDDGVDDAYDDLTDARCNSTTFIDSFFFPIDPPI